MPVDDARARPSPSRLAKSVDRRAAAPTRSAAPAAIARGDRVLGGVLQRAGQPQHLVGVLAVGRRRRRRRVIRPVVTVPVLSSTTVSTRRVDSSTSGPLIRMPSWAPRPVPTISAVGVARPERARAGDDQHGDRGGERRRQRRRRCRARSRGCATASAMTTGTKTPETRSASRCTCGLAVLRLLDQPGHLGELGVGADPGGPHDEPAAGVDGGADDGVARADLDRHRLAGEHRGVDRGACPRRPRRRWRSSRPGRTTNRSPTASSADRDPHLARRRAARRRPWRRAPAAPAAPRRPAAWPGPRSSGRPG